ncbi:MAG: dCMP deaminase family protein [Candidatus Izemoplasmatales bacterium]|jgi:dCMP deaminase|nr:dCMP deaminase family protein [Candidatus Izemoplasmatales bacterium]NLF48209.1 dCMP deaminase family protein [Acholeplasmataceae bacterium]MDD4354767.1 dCMP deaminase family protein [Candidatus Izemoplasmatales bacterium]MDD4987959.1 dCMP deaminase family protein [Candidatus Izemoplasmatales bacterium]MDD5601477.1 dCMP deaminase family protein [Candidatus Izemoplasmatales bacterium]
MKRSDYLSWDEYFMGVAHMSSMRSKDESSQVGACIVNHKNRIVGIGYNGFPIGCDDDDFPWERDGGFLDTKYAYVVHAEPNAILNATVPLDGARMYVTLFPCNECAKLIIQAGIKEVIFLSDKYVGTPSDIAAKRLFESAGVVTRQLDNYTLQVIKQ